MSTYQRCPFQPRSTLVASINGEPPDACTRSCKLAQPIEINGQIAGFDCAFNTLARATNDVGQLMQGVVIAAVGIAKKLGAEIPSIEIAQKDEGKVN